MTIEVRLTPGGTVGLIARGRGEAGLLSELPYVVRHGGVAATFWTHLSDLRRDLGRRLAFAESVKPRLSRLILDLDRREEGDDEEILSLFRPDKRPYPFQVRGIHAGLATERLLIADDTGLGKTIEAMGILFAAGERKLIRRAVLVVPAGLKYQWFEEIHEFAARPPPGVVVVSPGSRAQRRALYKKPWRVMIINPELLRNDANAIERVRGIDFVVLDEASCIRNPDTEIAACMKHLFAKTRFRFALTATPVENRLADLRSVFEWVDPRIFPSREYFEGRYVIWRNRRFKVTKRSGREVTVKKREPKGYRRLNEVRAKIRPSFIRRRVKDVGLELPEMVPTWENVELPPRQKKVYDAIKDRVADKIKDLRGAALRAPLQALRQACNSTELIERHGKSRPGGFDRKSRPAQVKVDRIRELLETELAGEQVLIFSEYERFGVILARELREHRPVLYNGRVSKRERDANVEAFKAGTRRVLIGTKALERGHNLQTAGVLINADLPFNPAAIKQRLGRIMRIGSKHQCVRMINMIALGTIEETLILKRIYSKRKVFEAIFDEDELTGMDPLEGEDGRSIGSLL